MERVSDVRLSQESFRGLGNGFGLGVGFVKREYRLLLSRRVYADDMSNPALGLLVQGATASTEYSFEYRDGKYIAQAGPTYQGEIFSSSIPRNSSTLSHRRCGNRRRRRAGDLVFVGCRAGTTTRATCSSSNQRPVALHSGATTDRSRADGVETS